MTVAISNAVFTATGGSLRLGPLLAFAVAASNLSLLGLGPAFWALVVGTGTSLVIEREAARDLRGPRFPAD